MALYRVAHKLAHHLCGSRVADRARSTVKDKMNNTEKTRTVRGEVILPSADLQAETADVVVQVEDVYRADALSVVIAEQRQAGLSLHGGAVLPFIVEVPAELVDEN